MLIRVFNRCGLSLVDVARQCEDIDGQFRPRVQQAQSVGGVSRDDWVQILNLWSLDPDYVDADGRPVPLRKEGPAPSVQALHGRVGSKLTLEEVYRQMLSTGAATEVKGRLVAAAHAPILFPAGSPEQSDHHLHFLHSALLNMEHNAAPPDGVRWVERHAICHQIPESALALYSLAAKDRAQKFLVTENATMHRIAKSTPTNGRSMQATIHVFFSGSKADSPQGSTSELTLNATRARRSQSARGSRKSVA